MAKTSCRFLHSTVIKKEECEDEPKKEKELLHSANTASKSRNKIKKNRKPIQVQITEVKSESVDDNKVLLTSPKKTYTRSDVTAEKITKLIGYVVNDKMNVKAAAKKVGISYYLALGYYQGYKDDPEHKIPLPKTRSNTPQSMITQGKIDNLIRYIVNDRMNVDQAAKKAVIGRDTAARYYTKYLEDPKQKIPLLNVRNGNCSKRYTQKDITDLIGYIVRDKMSLVEASKKANMTYRTAKRYYLKYLHDPNHEIPDPQESNPRSGNRCTNDQVSSLIRYIVNDRMTLLEASVKANMSDRVASKYYKQYLNDPEKSIPTPEISNSHVSNHPPTVDQVKTFFCYIIIDKLNVPAAARKSKISKNTGYKYYNKYLKSSHNQTKIKDMSYSVEKMKQLVELVQNEKMSLTKAADIVHLNVNSARKHYQQYLKNPKYGFPAIYCSQYTQEDIKKLIDHVEHDKMTVSFAARIIKMNLTTAWKYYKEYQNDPEHQIPVPMIRGQTKKNKTVEKYAQIIADIYKNNPLIKPVQENHDLESDVLAIKIKEELQEEDTKMALKKWKIVRKRGVIAIN